MSYAVGDVRRWNTGALTQAGDAVATRSTVAEKARRTLIDGGEILDEGWDGRAADAVIHAVESEKTHVTRLVDELDDLADALRRAQAALGPAVQVLRDRIADAEATGLAVTNRSVRPATGRDDVDQSIVDEYAEAISSAIDTVRSLDEHYGREIDEIASSLHRAVPPEVDRSPIPGLDDPWPGRGVDAMTGAMSQGLPSLADELDPATRGRHMLNPAPDDFGRSAGMGLRGMGRFAGPLGSGLTIYDGVKSYAEGETAADEAAVETAGALGGGMLGGAVAGAAAGTVFGPVGAIVGAGIGAAVGTYLGQKAGDVVHEEFMSDEDSGRWTRHG